MVKKIRSSLASLMVIIGGIALVMIILAFTSAPFWIWYNMSVKKAGIHRPPDYIIVMGGGGMPSPSGLMRCWYAARVAARFTRARVIVALPGDASDSLSSVNQMKKELVLRGVAPGRIFLEDSGTNTRAEALNVRKLIPDLEQRQHSSLLTAHPSLLIVTSPEHILRAVLTFKKAGFTRVDGLPAFEKTIEANLDFNARNLGAHGWIPDVGKNITLRYQFWMQMEYEFLVLREYLAIAYYKLQGWI